MTHPVVYTDGSCMAERGGYGVVVVMPEGDPLTYHGRVPINPCTNQKAELYAVLVACRVVTAREFTIYTDSKYAIGCCTTWLEQWKKSGWRKPVANRDLVEQIDQARGKDRLISFQYVPAHRGHKYNEMCDRLAKLGTQEELLS